MVKKKYRFNPDTLNYERIGISIKEKTAKIIAYFSSSLVFSLVLVFVVVYFYETPRTKALMRENQELLSQYELMLKDLEKVENVLKDLQQRDDNIYRVIFETDPIPSTVRKAGFGGTNKYSHLESLSNSTLIIETARKLDILSKEAYIQSKSFDEVMKLAQKKEEMLSCIPAIQPITNRNLKRTASGWGFRIHPIYKVRKMHYGMDFTAPVGTPVYATGNGKVTELAGTVSGFSEFGRYVKINHGWGYETVYAHLSKYNVKEGQEIKRGDIIGYVGNSGASTAPHLHYEVHKDGQRVNPALYYFRDLTAEEFDKMIAISSNIGQTLD
jgi:murein DD-endopeptidase MepM/ murein hydrolase activator NlpD